MDNYEKLLDKAYENVKQIDKSSERFEIPKIKGYFSGKKTILTNISQIVSYLRRNPEHFQKFLLKELAIPGQKEGDNLVLNIRISSEKINSKIQQYAKEFVLCRECGKPDTEIIKEDRVSFLHCLACGAKHPVRGKG